MNKPSIRSNRTAPSVNFVCADRATGGLNPIQAPYKNFTVNCLDPGSLLDTKMVRRAFSQPLGSAASGANVEVPLATTPELADISGAYYVRTTRSQAHEQAYDRQSRERLWQHSLELTGLDADITS